MKKRSFTISLRLREIPITEVMTPRVVVTALQQDMTIRQVLDEYPVLRFSRIPVFLNLSTKFKDWLFVLNYCLLQVEMNGNVFQEFMKPVEFLTTKQSVDVALDMLLGTSSTICYRTG